MSFNQLSRAIFRAPTAISLLLVIVGAANAAILPGHLLVADSNNLNSPLAPKIIDIDPATGAQTIVAVGGLLKQPTDMCLDPSGNIIVADYGYGIGDFGRIIRIDAVTGQQSVISSGGSLALPTSVVMDSQGRLIVAQQGANQTTGAVLRIDPITGSQQVVASGGQLTVAVKLAIEPSGNYLLANFQNPSGVIRVNATTGATSILSSGGLFALGPHGLTINSQQSNSALVTDRHIPGLVNVDTDTGVQSLVTSGGLLSFPIDVAQDATGHTFMADRIGRIVEVNLTTGAQSLVSSGGFLVTPTGMIAVVPEPIAAVLLACPILGRRRPKRGTKNGAIRNCSVVR